MALAVEREDLFPCARAPRAALIPDDAQSCLASRVLRLQVEVMFLGFSIARGPPRQAALAECAQASGKMPERVLWHV